MYSIINRSGPKIVIRHPTSMKSVSLSDIKETLHKISTLGMTVSNLGFEYNTCEPRHVISNNVVF